MNFSCEACGRLYSIADEKVQGRQFRVKCKVCEHLNVVRGPGAPVLTPSRPVPALTPSHPTQAAASLPPARAAPSGFAAADRDDPFGERPPPFPAAPERGAMSDAEMAWLAVTDETRTAPARGEASPAMAVASGPPAPRASASALAAAPRRRRALMLGAALGGAAVVGAALFLFLGPSRPRTRPAAVPEPALAAQPVPAAPIPGPAALPDPELAPASVAAASQAPAPLALPAKPAVKRTRVASAEGSRDRRSRLGIGKRDEKLLDLLDRKADAAPAAPVERTTLDTSHAVLDRAAVERTIADNHGAFGACVTKALKANPRLRVDDQRATMMLTVQPGGVVSGAWVAEADLERSLLGRCLVAASRRMVFPAFRGSEIDVSVPLALSAVR